MKITLLFKNLPLDLEDQGGMWLGIGFGTHTMLGSDIVICQWLDSTEKASCDDYKALTNGYPSNIAGLPQDEVMNVRFVSGVKANNMVEIKFRRFLQTGDSDDYQMTVGQTLNLIWAFGYPDRLYHGTANRGNQTVLLDHIMSSASLQLRQAGLMVVCAALVMLNQIL